MIRQLVLMFILSVIIGLLQEYASLYIIQNNAIHNYAFILGHALAYGVILMLISISIALIPKIIYWIIGRKRSPDIFIFAWSIWVPLVILFVITGSYYNYNNIKINSLASLPKYQDTAEIIYNKVANSIYAVYSENKENHTITSGGAVVVTPDYLATNCHIIDNGNLPFVIMTSKGMKAGVLYSSHEDLCLVSVPGMKFKPVIIGRESKNIDIGEDVYAIGNPNELNKSISNGIISNKIIENGHLRLLTNAAISPGSSGGGLFDHNAKLIGITTATYTGDNVQNLIMYCLQN